MRAMVPFVVMIATAHADPPCRRSLGVGGGNVVVCDASGCTTVTPKGLGVALPPSATVRRAHRPASRATLRGGSVCAGTTCKPLGPHARAAVRHESVAITDDLAVVVVGRDAWNVAGDRKLAFVKPVEYASDPQTKPVAYNVDVMHDLLVVTWKGCAGPCDWAQVVDRDGRNVGPWFPAGPLYELDARRVVVFGYNDDPSAATILDVATGTQHGSAPIGDEGEALLAPDGALVLMSAGTVSWFDTKTPKLTPIGELRLPPCP
jgi:hypothetical protein